MPRNSMDKVFQCRTGSTPQGKSFPVRIVIPEKMYDEMEKQKMRKDVEAILDQKPVEFLSPKEKRAGIKQEPGFYEFWTATKVRLRTSAKGLSTPTPNMTLTFDTMDKGLH